MKSNDLISRSAFDEVLDELEGLKAHADFTEGVMVVRRELEQFPAVDAEPVVYCKDCIHRGNDVECPMCTMEFTWDEDDGSDYYWIDRTADDGFCHCGAKMDGDKDAVD